MESMSLPSPVRRPARAVARPAQRMRRVLVTAALVCLLPAGVSYLHTLTEASNSSVGIRSVEWLRNNGAATLVAKVESIYYSLTAPSKGGPALKKLPQVGLTARNGGDAVAAGGGTVLDRPANVAPLTSPALPGEGVWQPTQLGESHAEPPLLVTTFRSDPSEYPRLVAGAAWINTAKTEVKLYAGRLEPSVTLPTRGPMEVPQSARANLLATFNSGFKLGDDHGGWALNGHTYAALQNGQATCVRYADGHYDVIDWQGGPRVPANVVFARQNLPLILEEGKLSPRLNDSSEWGATVGNAIQVWRSGIGVDAHGNLIYAAANYQTVRSLAEILRHAGAVRAMELDINSYWISFNTYAGPGAQDPTKLLSETERPAERYLSPDDRDFFAVFSR
jgi:hypothetical protein